MGTTIELPAVYLRSRWVSVYPGVSISQRVAHIRALSKDRAKVRGYAQKGMETQSQAFHRSRQSFGKAANTRKLWYTSIDRLQSRCVLARPWLPIIERYCVTPARGWDPFTGRNTCTSKWRTDAGSVRGEKKRTVRWRERDFNALAGCGRGLASLMIAAWRLTRFGGWEWGEHRRWWNGNVRFEICTPD